MKTVENDAGNLICSGCECMADPANYRGTNLRYIEPPPTTAIVGATSTGGSSTDARR
jgi:hypothetical protein